VITKFGSGSRLIFVFILTVVVSGSILTWLSINNISNYKELTEKKVLEEQFSIADQISNSFQKKLESVASEFTDLVLINETAKLQSLKLSDTIDGITSPFLIDKNETFLWPWFIEGYINSEEEGQSGNWQQYFNRAEKAEFREQDLNKAKVNYLASLKVSSNKYDSARVINALARLSTKSGQPDQAYQYYSTTISEFYSVLNTNGFPYVYFSILQILKITELPDTSEVINDIELFLSKMADGSIPLNQSTAGILTQITEWIDESTLTDNEVIVEIKNHTKKINSYLEFKNRFGNIIRESLITGKKSDRDLIIGIYNTINGISNENNELILINNGLDLPAGFVVELEQIRSLVLAENLPIGTEFEYDVEIGKKEILDPSNSSELLTTMELSPYFSSQILTVKLKDEQVIEKYVKRRKWIFGSALILLLGGMFLGFFLILQDINREKKLASLRSDFVATVTHELKTPLTSIYMFAESIFLGRAKSESAQKKYANIIVKESENLKRMINNILEYSIKENDNLKYQLKATNLSSLVKSAINDMNYWLELNKFNVHTEIQEEVEALIDPEAIKQALSNLISNAIKYSPVSKKLTFRLIKNDREIRLEVEDTGIGIPEDQIGQIFEKFYRVKSKDTESISGTGLGLTVTKDIIEAHNGKLFVSSELNIGTKFTIILNS